MKIFTGSMNTYEVPLSQKNSWLKKALWGGCFFYLITIFLTRLWVLLFSSAFHVQLVGIGGASLCLIPLFKPAWLKPILFCFAFSFPLYGSLPYSSHTFLFEFYLSLLSAVVAVNLFREGKQERPKTVLPFLLLAYFLLALASLLLLPVQDIFWKIALWDWGVFWNAVFWATPEQPLYSLASVVRLAMFAVFVVFLAHTNKSGDAYRALFLGLLAGALWSSVAGILGYYEFIDLSWFREVSGRGTRLQSVFANPGWFAEFLSTTIPFILMGFISPRLKKRQKISLFGFLVLCEIAIILTYSRTGWLIYPFVLLVCWFFFYVATQADRGRFSWNRIAAVSVKVMVSVPLTILLSYFIVFQVLDGGSTAGEREKEKFDKRISQLAKPVSRQVIWSGSFELIAERPFFGSGYESFKVQNSILKKLERPWDTPHNFYLQLLVSGGVAGLALWGLLIFATLYLLVADLIRNKSHFNIAVILSIIAFHLYGFAQSMQYIPMIWFLVFLNIGYAMTIDERLFPVWIYRKKPVWALLLLAIVFSGLVAYGSDFQSKKFADRHKLDIYSLDQELYNYLGFYSKELWEQGVYRWTGSSSIIKLPYAKMIEFTFVCSAPDLATDPLYLSVYDGKALIDRIAFSTPESKTRRYFFPEERESEDRLRFSVSRTWNPKKLGAGSDMRSLGVAISEPKILEEFPQEGMGFYNWERWDQDAVPGLGAHFPYRWTGVQAVFDPRKLNRHGVVYLRAGQPGLPHEPLRVDIVQEGHIIATTQLDDTVWHKLNFKDNLRSSKPCTISVSRTWVPQKMGVAEDFRVLGVAVAGISPESPP